MARIYLGISQPRGTPPNWASTVKLGELRKVAEVIKPAQRHLDRTDSSRYTRRSYVAYSYALLAIRP